MKAPITSEALLSVADTLARLDDASTTVHLRRAVSSAYYGLFHGLIADATRRTFGLEADREPDRQVLSRWYNHGEMRSVCQWVIRLASGQSVPDGVAALLADPPAELVSVARTFVQLQEQRHEADYDHTADLTEADALTAILRARAALVRLPALAGHRAYDNYLVLLLGGLRRCGSGAGGGGDRDGCRSVTTALTGPRLARSQVLWEAVAPDVRSLPGHGRLGRGLLRHGRPAWTTHASNMGRDRSGDGGQLELDPADVDHAGRALLGGIPPTPDELTRRRLAHALPELAAPAGELPRWATVGVQLGEEVVFARPTLDLDAAEAADARQWPPVTVAAYQTAGEPACVLVEVGASGPPTRFEPRQARRLSTALLDAAHIVDSILGATG